MVSSPHPLNLTLHAVRAQETHKLAAGVPELETVLLAQDRAETLLIALASILFLGGVFLVTVLETHKTVGAVYNLDRRLAEVAEGHYNVRCSAQERSWRAVKLVNDMAGTFKTGGGRSHVLDRFAVRRAHAGTPTNPDHRVVHSFGCLRTAAPDGGLNPARSGSSAGSRTASRSPRAQDASIAMPTGLPSPFRSKTSSISSSRERLAPRSRPCQDQQRADRGRPSTPAWWPSPPGLEGFEVFGPAVGYPL